MTNFWHYYHIFLTNFWQYSHIFLTNLSQYSHIFVTKFPIILFATSPKNHYLCGGKHFFTNLKYLL